jgi:four helix bundle protein
MTPQELHERFIDYGVYVCRMLSRMPPERVTAHVHDQLARSSTSVAGQYAEARSAQSRKDFIHKMHGCLKEARESYTWLRTLQGTTHSSAGITDLLDECDEIIAILVASIGTARKRGFRKLRSQIP